MDYSQFLYMREELWLLLAIVVLFIADLVVCGDRKSGRGVYNTPLPVLLLTAVTALGVFRACTVENYELFGGMYQYTPIMGFVKTILNIGTLIVFLMSHKWLSREENLVKQGEFYLLLLFTLLGMYFMISSGHFLMFFIGLEMASIPVAALVAYDKYRFESAEAGAKFILLALFSSALLLYGLSFFYAITGTLYLADMAVKMTFSWLGVAGLLFFISGMGFKLSLVPFHLWTADTYEGAPTSVTAYLSVISKSAAAFTLFIVLAKIFPTESYAPLWETIFFWLIVASITIANLFAIRQQNLKRFMAFSAISQAGYIALAIPGVTAQGMTALVFYLVVYMVANLGAFAVMASIEQQSGQVTIESYNGLYQTNPRLSFLMTLCLFSLAGIPPFAGFFSKFFVFMTAFNAGHHWLVFIALVNTIVSLYYYLLIVKAMYINKSETPIPAFTSDGYTKAALLLCLLGVVGLGIVSSLYNYIDALSLLH